MSDRPPQLSPLNTFFMLLFPLSAVAGLIYLYFSGAGFHWSDFFIFFVMYELCGLAITAGYHRYFSHAAYESRRPLKILFLLFGAAAFENSVLHWAADHRRHHRFVDTPADPYNIKQGLFWAHMGWIFYKSSDHPAELENVSDLSRDGWVKWQHRNVFLIGIIVSFGVPLLWGLYFERVIPSLVWGALLRIVVVHHCTFFINSLAHYVGTQPYSTRSTAKDCWWLAFLTFGEGYHNFHHTYPSDYRNGVRWYQWDPTKWLIALLSRFGETSKLRRIDFHTKT